MKASAEVATLPPHFGSPPMRVEHLRFMYLVAAIVIVGFASCDPLVYSFLSFLLRI